MTDEEQLRKSAYGTPRTFATTAGVATIQAKAYWTLNTNRRDCRCTPAQKSRKTVCPECRWRIHAEALTELGPLAVVTRPNGDHHFPVFGEAMPPQQEALRAAVRHVLGLAVENLPHAAKVARKMG